MRLPEFLFGMYLYKWNRKPSILIAATSFLGIIILLFIPMPSVPQMFKITLMGIVCYLVCFYIGDKITVEIIKKPFEWFTRYSFAIYLLHHVISEQIIDSFNGVILTRVELYLLFGIVLGADIFGGYISFHVTNKFVQKVTFISQCLVKEFHNNTFFGN